ncbi:MAG: AMP-binding protein, partial [Actinomycetota bacterium]
MLDVGSFWDLITRRSQETPGARMAIDESGRMMTFAEYRDEAERTAAGLLEMGIREGDVVSWQLPTWLESFVLCAALSRLQAIQNPILPIYREREVGFCTKQAGAKLLIVPGVWRGYDYTAMANSVAAANNGLEVLTVERGAFPDGDPQTLPPLPQPLPSGDPSTLSHALPDGQAVRWLFYTSGTTADPKGAQHTDFTIAATAR